MAGQTNWAKIGRVAKSHNTYRAEVDTYCLGERYKFTGPPRGSDEHKAYDDLLRIRASAEQALTRPEGLELMKSMARELRDAATAAQPNQPRKVEGGIETRRGCCPEGPARRWGPIFLKYNSY